MKGSFVHGLEHMQVHMRTMFEDISRGSEMQMSTFLLIFHKAALIEKRVPEELYLDVDNNADSNQEQIRLLVVRVVAVCTTRTQCTVTLHLSAV